MGPPASTRSISTLQSRRPKIRLMIVSEVDLYAEGLARSLAAQSELEVVEYLPGDVLLNLRARRPHIVLADAAIVLTTELVARAADSGAKVVVFAVLEDDVNEVLACAQAGVAGFVARNATMEELLATLLIAARGDVRCSPKIAKILVRRLVVLTGSGSYPGENRSLTRRQRDIIALIDRGLSNKEIATRLGIHVATVKNHVHGLLKKLQVHRRGEAAAIARSSARLRPQSVVLKEAAKQVLINSVS